MTCDDVRDLAAAYVLGALEADEADAVTAHLADCDQPHPEFAELGSVVPALAEMIDLVEPPAALRGRIMAAAAADLATRTAAASVATPARPAPASPAASVAAAPAPVSSPAPSAPARPAVVDLAAAREARRPSRVAWLMGLAAVLAIAALGVWNVSLRSDLSAAQAYQNHVDAALAAAARPGSSSAILTSKDDPQRSGLAVVAADGSVTIVARGLGANTGTTVYEAWVINATGPIAIGGFTVGSDGIGYLTTPPGPGAVGVTVALTLEPVPGNTAPAGPVISSGVVGT